MTTPDEQEQPSAAKAGLSRNRKARLLGIALVVVLGGTVAAMAGALPDSSFGRVIAYGLLAFILLLVLSRFLPDSALGGRVGRARARGR